MKPIYLSLIILVFSTDLYAGNNRQENFCFPYLEIGGAKYFNRGYNTAGVYNFFIPLLQKEDQLVFADLRVFDRSGSSFEGNVHLGYRKLFADAKKMFGLYAAIDHKRSELGNNFKQLTLGFEHWDNMWFIGGNFYKPIGKDKVFVGQSYEERLITKGGKIDFVRTSNKYYDRVLSGFDAEFGYEFNNKLTGYIGGYYFAANNANTVAGPKIRLTYDHKSRKGKFLGVLDGVKIELGGSHDKPRGCSVYIALKLKIGLGKSNNVDLGFSNHMIELVRRDPDVISQKIKFETRKTTRYQILNSNLVDESKLAWLVDRNLNVAEIFGRSNSLSSVYLPFVTNSNIIKHFAFLFADNGGYVVYYDNDSLIHGLPEDRNNYQKSSDSPLRYMKSRFGVNEIGFDNKLALKSIRKVAATWDRDSWNWNGKSYDLFERNCQHFVSEVMDEYSRHKRIYLKVG